MNTLNKIREQEGIEPMQVNNCLENRLGLIKVSNEVIRMGVVPDMLYQLDACPIDIIPSNVYGLVTYKCICNKFDTVPEGAKIPQYDIKITRVNNKNKYKAIRTAISNDNI